MSPKIELWMLLKENCLCRLILMIILSQKHWRFFGKLGIQYRKMSKMSIQVLVCIVWIKMVLLLAHYIQLPQNFPE